MYRDLATQYAGRGYLIVLIHYFNRTGAIKEDHDEDRELFLNYFTRKATPKVMERSKELFTAWTETVRDGGKRCQDAFHTQEASTASIGLP